jgi:hypothetical protein
MFKQMKTSYYLTGAMFTVGMLAAGEAEANNFGKIAKNINTSIADLPGLLTAMCYLFGILLAVLGILKIKDHVENPSNTPLKDGAIRLCIGGFLFALPILFEAMANTIDAGTDGAATTSSKLQKVQFNVL